MDGPTRRTADSRTVPGSGRRLSRPQTLLCGSHALIIHDTGQDSTGQHRTARLGSPRAAPAAGGAPGRKRRSRPAPAPQRRDRGGGGARSSPGEPARPKSAGPPGHQQACAACAAVSRGLTARVPLASFRLQRSEEIHSYRRAVTGRAHTQCLL